MTNREMLVADLMTAPVVVIGPGMCTGEVLTLAYDRRVHHFPVVRAGALVGLVCTCDLREASPQQSVNLFSKSLNEVVTVTRDTTAYDAARTLQRHAVGSAVVTEGVSVIGIVTREDLVEADPELAQLMEESRCVSCGTLHHLRGGPDGRFQCADCRDRAKGDDWLDLGGGD
jgi:CBS domain-containing protein